MTVIEMGSTQQAGPASEPMFDPGAPVPVTLNLCRTCASRNGFPGRHAVAPRSNPLAFEARSISASMKLGDLVVDRARREARLDDRRIGLTRIEFGLLAMLAECSPGCIYMDELLERVIDGPKNDSGRGRLRFHIANLRRKLEPSAVRVLTIRGTGYRLDVLAR